MCFKFLEQASDMNENVFYRCFMGYKKNCFYYVFFHISINANKERHYVLVMLVPSLSGCSFSHPLYRFEPYNGGFLWHGDLRFDLILKYLDLHLFTSTADPIIVIAYGFDFYLRLSFSVQQILFSLFFKNTWCTSASWCIQPLIFKCFIRCKT